MFAVVVYFWRQWRDTYFQSTTAFKRFAALIVLATALTGLIGETIIKAIERTFLRSIPHAEIEDLFSHLELVAPALAIVGVLILLAALIERRKSTVGFTAAGDLSARDAAIIGAVQGLCLPFRGFSRSGATISTGMLLGVARSRAEMFSFALAVVLTPVVVVREVMRLVHAEHTGGPAIPQRRLLTDSTS
jgi:undecaprenyl-diphosphatase